MVSLIVNTSVSAWLHLVPYYTVSGKPYLLYHDADTEEGSPGSPVIVAEQLQTPDGPRDGLAIIALHTEAAKKQSNIATLLTPLIDML